MLERGQLVNIVAGTLGSMVGDAVIFPIDQVKTQILSGKASTMPPTAVFRELVRTRGVIGLYNGLPAPLAGAFAVKGTLFAGYELCQVAVRSLRPLYSTSDGLMDTPLSVAERAAAGCGGGLLAAFVITPVERTKIVMQLPQPSRRGRPYSSTLAAAVSLAKERSLFVGLSATAAREGPAALVYFTLYDLLKAFLSGDGPAPSWTGPVAGGIAGMLQWAVTMPADVAKTRVQGGLSVSLSSGLRDAWQEGALFRGIQPVLLRALIKHGTVFTVYEAVRPHLLTLI